MDLRQLQLVELDILKAFIEVCDQYQLTYYLGWGSCLGAVRHHGFIPWDDDIDVLMPYPDYIRLKTMAKDILPKDLFFQDHDTDPHFFLSFGKIRKRHTTFITRKYRDIDLHWGIGMDIFPLYELPDTYSKKTLDKKIYFFKKFLLRDSFVYSKMNKQPQGKDKILYFIKKSIYLCMPKPWVERNIKKLRSYFADQKGSLFIDLEGYETINTIYDRAMFGQGKMVPFENIMVRIPEHDDEYLIQSYGKDYMDIPKAGSHLIYQHEGVIVDLEKDYREYQNI